MSRLSLSIETLTSHDKAACWQSSTPEKTTATSQTKSDDSFLAELLKPRQLTGAAEADLGNGLSLAAAKSRGGRDSVDAHLGAAKSPETSAGDVILATTYSSILFFSGNGPGKSGCFLKPRESKDQYGLEWYQRELEFLQANPSDRLLGLANESSCPDLKLDGARATEEVIDSLESRIRRSGPLSALQARTLLSDCLKALDEFHKHGRLHGELNPSRILYASNNRLVLFGSPGFRPEDELRPLFSLDLFAAPELLNPEDFGKISRASDLYCLGHIMLYSLLGKSYFGLLKVRDIESPRQAECLAWHGSQADRLPEIDELLPDAPPTLVSVIARLVEKESKQRYQTVSEALADLNATFSKTRKGKLEKRKSSNLKGVAEVASMLHDTLGPVTPPPLVEQTEPKRNSKFSRLPTRILLSSLALLLLLLVSGMLSSSNPAEQVSDTDVSGESERNVVETTTDNAIEIASEQSTSGRVDAEPPIYDDNDVEGASSDPETEGLMADNSIPIFPATKEPEYGEDAAYSSSDLVPESDALLARGLDKANLASADSKPAASIDLKGDMEASERRLGVNQDRAIAVPQVESVKEIETPEERIHEVTLVTKTEMAKRHASQEYLDQLRRILSSFRHKSYLKRHEAHAPWFESTARKVDALQTDGIDPAAIEAGQFVASMLRSTATQLREASSGIAPESRAFPERSRSAEPLQLVNFRQAAIPSLFPQAEFQTITQQGESGEVKIPSPQAMSQHALAEMTARVAEAQRRLAEGQ